MYTFEDFKSSLPVADKLMTKTTGINFFYIGNTIVSEEQAKKYFETNKREIFAALRKKNDYNITILQNYCLLLFGKRDIYYSRFPEENDPYPNIKLSTWFARYILKYRPNIHVLIEKVQEWLKEGKVLVEEADGYFFKKEPNVKPYKDFDEWLFIQALYMDEQGTVLELSNCHDSTITNPQNILAFKNPATDGYVAPKGRIKFLCTVNTRYGCMDSLKSLRGQGKSYLPYVQKVQHYTELDLSHSFTQIWEVVQ